MRPIWSDETDARLRELWDQGVPSKGIAAVLGCSPGAILDRAKRLDLTPRKGRMIRGARELAHAKNNSVANGVTPPLVRAFALSTRDRFALAIAPSTPQPPLVIGAPRECQWPEGEPRQPGFRFCNAPAVPDRPYCADHCRIAFIGFGHARTGASYTFGGMS